MVYLAHRRADEARHEHDTTERAERNGEDELSFFHNSFDLDRCT